MLVIPTAPSSIEFTPATGVPVPDVAGRRLLLVLAEPGVPSLVALALADEAVAVLVQRQEGCACPLALLGRQQPQQRVLDDGRGKN